MRPHAVRLTARGENMPTSGSNLPGKPKWSLPAVDVPVTQVKAPVFTKMLLRIMLWLGVWAQE